MKFQHNLGGLRPLITRLILITCVCISGLLWLQSRADQDFKLTIDDASPPAVQLSFDAVEDAYYYPEYYEPGANGAPGTWIPIPGSEQFFHAGKQVAFVEVPGQPLPRAGFSAWRELTRR